MYRMFRILVCTVLLTSLTQYPAYGSSPTYDATPDIDSLVAAVTNHVVDSRGHGVALVVFREGRLILERTLGTDKSAGTTWSNNSIFRIASVSKIVMAISALSLFEENNISLDTPVIDLVADLPIDNPFHSQDPVRLRHLLEHTSGIHEMIVPFSDAPRDLGQLLGDRFNPAKVRIRPGTFPIYSNFNYIAVNRIVEVVAGKPFTEVIEERLFSPLGMRDSGFDLNEIETTNLVYGYFPGTDRRIEPEGGPYAAAAGMYASANDMARFLEMLLDRGEFRGTRVVSSNIIEAIETPRSSIPARNGLNLGHGPGAVRRQSNGRIYAGHNGLIDGFSARLFYSLEREEGYFLALNTHPLLGGPSLSKLGGLIENQLFVPQDSVRVPDVWEAEAFQEGFYEYVSPRFFELGFFLALSESGWLSRHGDTLVFRTLLGSRLDYVPSGNNQFRRPHESETSLIFSRSSITDSPPRPMAYRIGNHFYEKRSEAFYWMRIFVAVTFFVSFLIGLAAPFLLKKVLSKRNRQRGPRDQKTTAICWISAGVASYSLATSLFLVWSVKVSSDFTTMNVLTFSLYVLTTLLPLAVSLGFGASVARLMSGFFVSAGVGILMFGCQLTLVIVLISSGFLPLRYW